MVDGGAEGGGGGRQPLKMAALAGGGLEFAAAICVGVFGGQWLDSRFGTSPWLTIVGTFAGAGGGFYRLYQALNKAGTPRRPT
jgi:ATP synthase protein I